VAGWPSKGDRSFAIDVRVHTQAGTVDLVREVAPGRFGGASMRAVPRMGGGTVVVITLPVLPDADSSDVAAVLSEELATIAALLEP
jgi:hypothetical protein